MEPNSFLKGCIMHRAFISERDYESYETRERAAQRRQGDREVHMAAHAVYEGQKPKRVGDERTRAINARFGIPDTYAADVPERFRKGDVPVMKRDELAKGPNLPHRDDRDVSARSRDAAAKAGYYHAGTDAFSSDAYMGKPDPIERKAGAKRKRRHFTSEGDEYFVTHGAGRWGKPLTTTNKHLTYLRDPTARDALANVADNRPVREPEPRDYFTIDIPREFLVMLAKVSDIQAKRGKLDNNRQGDMLRQVAERVPPGEAVTVDLYSPSDVLAMTRDLPKRYRNGQFGQLMKDIATHAKLAKLAKR